VGGGGGGGGTNPSNPLPRYATVFKEVWEVLKSTIDLTSAAKTLLNNPAIPRTRNTDMIY